PNLLEKFEQRQANGEDAASAPNMAIGKTLAEMLGPRQLRAFRQGTPQQRLESFQALPRDKQDEGIGAMPPGLRQGLLAIAPPELRRRIEMANGPQQMVARDLSEG